MDRRHAALIVALLSCGVDRGSGGAPVADGGRSAEGDAGPVAVPGAWLQIGLGEEAFAAVAADGRVPVIRGPQGSWMVIVALRGGGVPAGDALVQIEARDGAGALIANMRQRTEMLASADGSIQAAGLLMPFDPDVRSEVYDGRVVRLHARLTSGGALVETTLDVTLAFPA